MNVATTTGFASKYAMTCRMVIPVPVDQVLLSTKTKEVAHPQVDFFT